jgi:hypothetical protein
MVLRPPPPWPTRSKRERVHAAQLRPDDWLVTDEGLLRILDVEHSASACRLLSNGAWWQVPASTRFVRVRRSRQIVMRPDLRRKRKPNEEDRCPKLSQ